MLQIYAGFRLYSLFFAVFCRFLSLFFIAYLLSGTLIKSRHRRTMPAFYKIVVYGEDRRKADEIL
jgi:flagellar biosynthesis protein FliR